MSARVYLPATLPLLRAWLAAGEVPAGCRAHAVTDRLRAEYAGGGEEELEYVALTAAAQDAVPLLEPADVPRRVVLAVDVPEVRPAGGDDPTAVVVPGSVPLRDLAAVHADSADAEPAVSAARDSRDADEAVHESAWERCLDHELGWYANQEVEDLLRLGDSPEV